jgi:hypothetical protein
MTPFVDAVASIGSSAWNGTATELCAMLPAELRPSLPSRVTIALKAALPDLAAAGVEVRMWRGGKPQRTRMIGLRRMDDMPCLQNNAAESMSPLPQSKLLPPATHFVAQTESGAEAPCDAQFRGPLIWIGEPCKLAEHTRCRSCNGGRWWSADSGSTWQCASCYAAPAVFPGQPPLTWATP